MLEHPAEDGRCRVNILVSKTATNEVTQLTAQSLVELGLEEIETQPRMCMIHASTPIAQIREIAEMEQVDWIDIEKSAPLKSVLD
eukprot:s1_g2077.t1